MTNKIYETAKRTGRRVLATGLVALALSGCSVKNDSVAPEQRNSGSVYLTTAKNVKIEPHYGADKMFMDGISVIRQYMGDGLNVSNACDTSVYSKGSVEYAALRPLLTVEKQY